MLLASSFLLVFFGTPAFAEFLGKVRAGEELQRENEEDITGYATAFVSFSGLRSGWWGIKGMYLCRTEVTIERFDDCRNPFLRNCKDFTKAIVSRIIKVPNNPKRKEKVKIMYMIDTAQIEVTEEDRDLLVEHTELILKNYKNRRQIGKQLRLIGCCKNPVKRGTTCKSCHGQIIPIHLPIVGDTPRIGWGEEIPEEDRTYGCQNACKPKDKVLCTCDQDWQIYLTKYKLTKVPNTRDDAIKHWKEKGKKNNWKWPNAADHVSAKCQGDNVKYPTQSHTREGNTDFCKCGSTFDAKHYPKHCRGCGGKWEQQLGVAPDIYVKEKNHTPTWLARNMAVEASRKCCRNPVQGDSVKVNKRGPETIFCKTCKKKWIPSNLALHGWLSEAFKMKPFQWKYICGGGKFNPCLKSVYMPIGTKVRILCYRMQAFRDKKDFNHVWVHAHGITFKMDTVNIIIPKETRDHLMPLTMFNKAGCKRYGGNGQPGATRISSGRTPPASSRDPRDGYGFQIVEDVQEIPDKIKEAQEAADRV